MKEEFLFCLSLFEKQGFCNFGGKTKCSECASLYLLWKIITGEVLHDENMNRLTLNDWKIKSEKIK